MTEDQLDDIIEDIMTSTWEAGKSKILNLACILCKYQKETNTTVSNIPEQIYLQIGENVPDDIDFNDLKEVTWSRERIYANDIIYIKQ